MDEEEEGVRWEEKALEDGSGPFESIRDVVKGEALPNRKLRREEKGGRGERGEEGT